jgi:hypothetical protein
MDTMCGVNRRFVLTLVRFVFVCCSIMIIGCTIKKYGDDHARPSADWVKNAVVYEINLHSYSRGGGLKELKSQIQELKKFGITTVSLIPIHPIGELNRKGKYGSPTAVKDYYAINPEFGTMEDLKELIRAIHQEGMKILIDLGINQAAWDSQLLMEHPDWFIHNEEGAIVAPNSERSDVAQLDLNQHELRKYMIAMMKYWVRDIGVDGFQCTSAELVPTDFWDIARGELDRIKPVLMISNGSLPAHHVKAFDLTGSWNLTSTIAAIMNGKVSASVINDSLSAEALGFPTGSLHYRCTMMKDEYGENHPAKIIPPVEKSIQQTADINTILAFTLPGVPLISSDDESGHSQQLDLLKSKLRDMDALYRYHPAFQYGVFQNVPNSENYHLFSFLRYLGEDSVLIVINFTREKKDTEIQLPAGASLFWKDQSSGVRINVKNSCLRTTIGAFGFRFLVPSSEKEKL